MWVYNWVFGRCLGSAPREIEPPPSPEPQIQPEPPSQSKAAKKWKKLRQRLQSQPPQPVTTTPLTTTPVTTTSVPDEVVELSKRERYTVLLLCLIRVLKFMDFFACSAILTHIQSEFNLTDDWAGLLPSSSIAAYVIFSLLFNYLSDRISRRRLILTSMFFFCSMIFVTSAAKSFKMFFICRFFVGAGETGFAVIAPTIISDIVLEDERTMAFAAYNLAIPIGTGLGYIVSGKITHWTNGQWRWGLRCTPILGFISLVFYFFSVDPVKSEKALLRYGNFEVGVAKYKEDLKYIFKNPSILLSSVGFCGTTFVSGAFFWWLPKFLFYSFQMIPGGEGPNLGNANFQFGANTILSGITGVTMGAALSKFLKKFLPWVDPVICGIGLLIAFPLYILALNMANTQELGCLLFLGIAQVMMCLNWEIHLDILMYVVIPTRRATAEQLQLVVSQAFGNLCSPLLVGVISRAYKEKWMRDGTYKEQTIENMVDMNYHSLQMSMAWTLIALIIGGFVFISNGFYIERDRKLAIELTHVYTFTI